MSKAERQLRVAVGIDSLCWHRGFAKALDDRAAMGAPLVHELVDMESSSWAEVACRFDVLIWKPSYMGPRSADILKEKVYVLERHCGMLVVPNFESVWHFESKVAQSYLFARYSVPTPVTTVTHNADEAAQLVSREDFPLVFKKSYGAAASNVRLVKRPAEARRALDKEFAQDRWDRHKSRRGAGHIGVLTASSRFWFWEKVRRRIVGGERHGVAYWQRFVPDNQGDLRVFVIGDMYALGVWRRNRPGDFRASGSGLWDTESPLPENAVKFCVDFSRAQGYDSMGYDLLFENGRFLVVEMCHGYPQELFHAAAHHYVVSGDDFRKVSGHVWPQELWVAWALQRAVRELGWKTPTESSP